MNDPNGPIYHNGRWHLFYQYNPEGDQWGEIGWGHASSTDLQSWKEHNLAIAADAEHFIFSGSVIHDARNESGLGTGDRGLLIAFYTGHTRTGPQRQVQCLAFSNDDGETWCKYSKNPIIDIGEANFRDPKVFWHEPTSRWIMLTVLAAERAVLFFTSRDLISWEQSSRFDAPIHGEDEWECPDLQALPVINSDDHELKWVLFVSVGGGAPAGGVGVQYFVGDFDGKRFSPVSTSVEQWVDHGPDFYAPQSFAGIDSSTSGGIWIGWMNNWIYAKGTFANPSRGMMTSVRRTVLARDGENYHLVQKPRGNSDRICLPIDQTYSARLVSELEECVELEIDPGRGHLKLDRTGLSDDLPSELRRSYEVRWDPLPGAGASMIKDEKGVEVFLNGGRVAFSALLQFKGTSVHTQSNAREESVS